MGRPHRQGRPRWPARLGRARGHLDGVRAVPGLARQAGGTRGARRRGRRARPLLHARDPQLPVAIRSRVRRARRLVRCARSSTTPTKWTTRTARPTGRHACWRSSRRGAATTCGSTCPRCSATTRRSATRACSRTTARPSPTCCSRRSRREWREWAAGKQRDRPKPGARVAREHPRPLRRQRDPGDRRHRSAADQVRLVRRTRERASR